jgi:hypothetical protein
MEDSEPPACCCEGDVQAAPVCTGGALVCPAGYGLYHGSECSCSGPGAGPCCIGGPHEGGADAIPETDATPEASSTCAEDALFDVSCCCDGDIQSAPTCSADGMLVCPAGRGLYHGADCGCPGMGPCCIGHDGGHD